MNFSDMMSSVSAASAAEQVAQAVGITPPPAPAPTAVTPRNYASDAMDSVGGAAGAGLTLGGVVLGYVILRYFRIIPKLYDTETVGGIASVRARARVFTPTGGLP